MEKHYNVTPGQVLLLDKKEEMRNYTIDMAIKINEHLDKTILLKAFNEEIKRNEGLRLHCFRKFFTWKNKIDDVYTIDEIKSFEYKTKTKQEIELFIDSLCEKKIILKSAKEPFEFYQIVTDDGDYLLLRVLHVNMDAYAVMLTLSDIIKVYYSIKNNNELSYKLTNISDYFENYEKNIDVIKNKTKQDNKFFIDYSDSLGEPQYLSCAGGYDNTKSHRGKFDLFRAHPCSYYEEEFSKDVSSSIQNYCKENSINIASFFLAILEIFYSYKNNNFKDVSMFFTANLRAKLSEKRLPLSTSNALFYRRIINDELSLKEFVKECDNDYLIDLKHYNADISAIMKHLLMTDMLHINGRYDEIVLTLIPTSFDGLPDGVQIDSYWPKAKEENDFTIYFVLLINSDGSLKAMYRYLNDMLKHENIVSLNKGIISIIEKGLINPDIKVKDLIKKI